MTAGPSRSLAPKIGAARQHARLHLELGIGEHGAQQHERTETRVDQVAVQTHRSELGRLGDALVGDDPGATRERAPGIAASTWGLSSARSG